MSILKNVFACIGGILISNNNFLQEAESLPRCPAQASGYFASAARVASFWGSGAGVLAQHLKFHVCGGGEGTVQVLEVMEQRGVLVRSRGNGGETRFAFNSEKEAVVLLLCSFLWPFVDTMWALGNALFTLQAKPNEGKLTEDRKFLFFDIIKSVSGPPADIELYDRRFVLYSQSPLWPARHRSFKSGS